MRATVTAIACALLLTVALPADEESIRYRSDDGVGYAIVASFGW